ncbi:hypothetical protein ACH5RR_040581 [Cinchona calisaya]|uniref:CTLH domain-containing protein n=1 Tax=Cinchona calisaya TaxID=153742 RepID=A0ABD2XS28_9GENT
MDAEAFNKDDIVFVVLQFLRKNYKGAGHNLEKESGLFFDMNYLEDCVKSGDWDDLEYYLSGFTKVGDNNYSNDIFFLIQKQKYYEALAEGEYAKANEIFREILQVFSATKLDNVKEFLSENKEHNALGDTKSNRTLLLNTLKELIKENPAFLHKLQFPTIQSSRVSRIEELLNQSLKWQHQQRKCINPDPKTVTHFVDHSCPQLTGIAAPAAASNLFMRSISGMPYPTPITQCFSGPMSHPSFVAHQPPPGGPINPYLFGRMFHPSSVAHQTAPGGPMPLYPSGGMVYPSFEAHQTAPRGLLPFLYPGSSVSVPIHPSASTNYPALNYQTATSEHVSNRFRLLGTSHQSPMNPIHGASSLNAGPHTGVADGNAPVTANVSQPGHLSFAVHQTAHRRPMNFAHASSSVMTPTNNPAATSEQVSKRLRLLGTFHQSPMIPSRGASSSNVQLGIGVEDRNAPITTNVAQSPTTPIDVASSSHVRPSVGVADRNAPVTANDTQKMFSKGRRGNMPPDDNDPG